MEINFLGYQTCWCDEQKDGGAIDLSLHYRNLNPITRNLTTSLNWYSGTIPHA